MTAYKELFEIADQLEAEGAAGQDAEILKTLSSMKDAASTVGRSFSGSWLGYHARVYYANFELPPPGAHFSQEWGMKESFSGGTRGDWREHGAEQVKRHIRALADDPDLSPITALSTRADAMFRKTRADIESILQTELASGGPDGFLEKLRDELGELEILAPSDVARLLTPQGQVMTRDTIVLGQGTQLPPHIAIKAEVLSIENSFGICIAAGAIARKAASHLERKSKRHAAESRVGTNVFIGHGRAAAWRDLKDFVQERLRLPWDEFNRVPVAGVTNIARLSEMMDSAAIAFLVMTAEDEHVDGTYQARMNVVHEAGLFQGRLGFTRAIVLLEEGCAEFSNISGLGQIRFPQGNIAAAFEEIRRVLEREGLIQ